MFSGWGLSWGGWLDNRSGEWWLMGQLFLIGAHLLPVWPQTSSLGVSNWPWQLNLLGALFVFGGLFLAIQAFLSLGSSLSPLPEPKQGNRLVCSGAYKRCRHPMYQAVLLCSLGVVIGVGSPLHLLLFQEVTTRFQMNQQLLMMTQNLQEQIASDKTNQHSQSTS